MLNKSKTLTGTVPVCLAGHRDELALPAHTRQGQEGHSQSVAWAFSHLAATRPRALLGINCHDTPLIPRDTPVTKKRQRSPLPRSRRRHITELRHIASSGSHSGYEAPVNSYLTGASPICWRLCSARGAGEPTRSSLIANTRPPCLESPAPSRACVRSSLLHSSAAPLRRSHSGYELSAAPSDARATDANRSRTGRCV
jgi:hypothetical protein